MSILNGYAGLWSFPLNNQLDKPANASYIPNRSSVYCVTSMNKRDLIMVPLVPNFFETAYTIARNTAYQKIYILMPSCDAIFISDLYILYYKLHTVLNKDVEIFCAEYPDISVTDDFISHVTEVGYDTQHQITEYPDADYDAEHCNFLFSFPDDHRPKPRQVSDVSISIGDKTILLCLYVDDIKINDLSTNEMCDLYQEVHIPFDTTIYGGLGYMKARKLASTRLLIRMWTYGFQNDKELELLHMTGNRRGKVIFNDLV